MLFADHSPKPAVQEMKFLYQGFVVEVGAASFELTSRMLFTSSSAYECVVRLAREGTVLREDGIETDVAPGASAEYGLAVRAARSAGGVHRGRVAAATVGDPVGAREGHEVAFGQGVFAVETPPLVELVETVKPPELIDGIHNAACGGDTSMPCSPSCTAAWSRTGWAPLPAAATSC